MTTRLHQILALEKGAKSTTESAVTKAYHEAQRPLQFAGLTRVYTPKDSEDGDTLPTERKRVQTTVAEVLAAAAAAWTRAADLVATKDATNQTARADVVLPSGEVLLADVPVTTLLYLEKTLVNVRTLVAKLPVLDPEFEWQADPATGLWRSAPEETTRTKKVPKAFTKAPATEKHAAQVDVFTEDVVVGTWHKTLFSGAVPSSRRAELVQRVETLSAAVKVARERANEAEVVEKRIGEPVFSYLFG